MRKYEMAKTWEKTVFVVIDVQLGLFTGDKSIYKAEELLENINSLTGDARTAKIPIIYIQHINKGDLKEGTEGHKIHPELKQQKEDLLYKKTVSSMFEETDIH
ncbi:MAG: isochorismatase family protein, partial [Candidatus Heimdallarchaeaceae archaeon]